MTKEISILLGEHLLQMELMLSAIITEQVQRMQLLSEVKVKLTDKQIEVGGGVLVGYLDGTLG